MNRFVVIHSHDHGADIRIFKTELEFAHLPEQGDLARLLGLDFEPDRGEDMNVVLVSGDADLVDLDSKIRQELISRSDIKIEDYGEGFQPRFWVGSQGYLTREGAERAAVKLLENA